MAVQVKASFKLTGWNGNQLKLRVPQILTKYDAVLGPQLKEEIRAKQYSWPRQTKRKNGQPVSSPRDIVDLGGLLRSQERVRGVASASQLVYRWNASYAGLILTGYTTSKGTVVPGRNWIKSALEKQPLEPFFAAEWKRLSGIGGL